MKKIILLIFCIVLSNCKQNKKSQTKENIIEKDEIINCDNEKEIEKVKNIFKDNFINTRELIKISSGIDINEDYVDELFKKYVKILLIRTKKVDNELKSCNCAGVFTIKFPEKIKKILEPKYEKNSKQYKNSKKEINSKFLIDRKVNILYNFQKTSDNNIFAETKVPNKEVLLLLTSNYIIYHIFKEDTNKNKGIKDENQDKNEEYFSSEGDFEYYESTVNNLRIRDKPSLNSKAVGKIKKNTSIKVFEKTDFRTKVKIRNQEINEYWYRIETDDGKLKGWVHGCCIEIIPFCSS